MERGLRFVSAKGVLALACLAPSLVQAQIGVTLCACQPSVYTFQLNFSAVCDVSTIDSRLGVRGADCFARGIGLFADDTFDFVPVQVTTVSIIELNSQFQVLAQTPYQSKFRDGDKVTYTSILGTPAGVAEVTPATMPAGLQIDIVGINAFEQPITNVWIILFDNICGVFPVLEKGDQIGWTIVDDIRLPYQSVCPVAGSIAPTPSPKVATDSPSSEPSKAPVVKSIPAMEEPTFRPTEFPSEAPEEAPICIQGKGKAGKGKSGKGKSGKAGSGKAGNGKSGSGKAGSGKAGSGKAGKAGSYDDDMHLPSTDGYVPTIRDFYQFGVTARSAGSHPVDYGGASDYRDSGKGKGSYKKSESDDDDDDDECLPPKKKKVSKNSSQKKLQKKGKGKSSGKTKGDHDSGKGKAGKGKAGKAYSEADDDHEVSRDDDLMYSGKGKGGKSGSGDTDGKAGGKRGGKAGGKAGSKHGDQTSTDRLHKKLEDRNPSRSSDTKLAKSYVKVKRANEKVPSRPSAQPVAPTPSSEKAMTNAPTKAPIVSTSAPSIPLGTLNMQLLHSRINHWFQEHGDTSPDGDRRSLR